MLSTAHAFDIDVGNPSWDIHWDNTIRYDAGMRAEGKNKDFNNSAGYDDTENKFSPGNFVTSRFDLLTEFDAVYQNRFGGRVSAAAWYDAAYTGKSQPNSALGSSGNYKNNSYNHYFKNYIRGPSGELLDAFVFANVTVAGVGVNARAGQHNVYWGESLYSVGNSIAYSQGPVDSIKSALSPGAEAKELFLPLNQISAQFQLNSEWSVAAQYYLDWKPFRLVPGGAFFGQADALRSDYAVRDLLGGAGPIELPVTNGGDLRPHNKTGNFGVSVRWSPGWGTAGLYFRKFDEKVPWSFTQVETSGSGLSNISNHLSYARDTKLIGASVTTTIGVVSVAAELSYRIDSALNSASPTVMNSDPSYADVEGARGDTWHGLINGIYLLPRTFLWEGGTLQGEVNFAHLDHITKNASLYAGKGHEGCTTEASRGSCVTRDSVGLQIGFTPEWPAAFPGWDLSAPMSFSYGLYGNTPTLAGTNEGAYTYSIGITGTLNNVHEISLKWIDGYARYHNAADGSLWTNGPAAQNNHGWVSLSYKTTF